MEDNQFNLPDTPPQYPSEKPKWEVWRVLLVGFLILILGAIILNLLMFGLMPLFGINIAEATDSMNKGNFIKNVTYLRIILFSNQVLLFLLPALITAYLAYTKHWAFSLGFERPPHLFWVFICLVWWTFSLPLLQFMYWINLQLPMAEWLKDMDTNQNELIEFILQYKNGFEFLLAIFLVSILPAICEELFFRGFLQRQLIRFLGSETAAVFAGAFIFSAIHMQFQGFLPRMFMGIMMGFALAWTRSLWTPIIMHAAHNLVSIVGFLFLGMKASDQESEFEYLNEHFELYMFAAALSWTIVYFLGKYIKGQKITPTNL